MRRLPPSPRFWLAAFLLWFGVLWVLSSFAIAGPETPPVTHFDKVAHFGFFFGGSGLLTAFFYRLNPGQPNWKLLFIGVVGVLAAVGALDEWRQSHVPGRSGNDLADWLADVTGAVSGCFVFKAIHHRLKWFS
ncbi:MAG: VanZ family protein [Akkermansiaceae bacterium]